MNGRTDVLLSVQRHVVGLDDADVREAHAEARVVAAAALFE